MNSVYDYNSYRTFLRDFFEKKKSTEGYTYRDFSRAAGMNSSSWLLHLIRGTKNLSENSALKAARAAGLSDDESEFFLLLVRFTQAKRSPEKDRFFQEMLFWREEKGSHRIGRHQYEYYTRWYHPVLRSLVDKVDWHDDYALLGRKVVPPISASQARQSVALLKRLKLIDKDEHGAWHRSSQMISTGDEVDSLNVRNYHKQVSELAKDAYDNSDQSQREISALTLGVGEKEFSQIKERIAEFRKELIELVREADSPDRVYQLNLQFFPVSRMAIRKNQKDTD